MRPYFALLLLTLPLSLPAQQEEDRAGEVDAAAEAEPDPCAGVDEETVRKAMEAGQPGAPQGQQVEIPKACLDFLEEQRKALEAALAKSPKAPVAAAKANDTPDDGGDDGPDDEDFVPSEEISEDYPVPLPSDI